MKVIKSFENPILLPDSANPWEAKSAFNPSVIKDNGIIHMLYRAQSEKVNHLGADLEISTIGHTQSKDGVHFGQRNKLIKPEYDWEKFGCEDPRVTKIDDIYYIFYTALSKYPFSADGIKVALATSKDFKSLISKKPVTTFNSKGMVLFPEKINGKFVSMLTVNTDIPPSVIAIAEFESIEDITSPTYWDNWYKDLDSHKIDLLRDSSHQVEVGAVPIKTNNGWLIVYSYIKNYFSTDPVFGIEAALLDLDNPNKIIARTDNPILIPSEEYEMYGNIPYTIFPTGSLINGDDLYIYYGGCDTTGCLASVNLEELMDNMLYPSSQKINFQITLERYEKNPIISPNNNFWESKYTYNPAAINIDDQIHILYRAQGDDDTSTFGYARTSDGFKIEERLDKPIYTPREDFEIKKQVGFSGCEDPRLTLFDDKIYMFYTAYDGISHTKIAMSYILKSDFLEKNWNWSKPVLVSPREINDKNACLLSEKINDKYLIFHRTNHSIWIDEVDNLDFSDGKWIQGNILLEPQENTWYSEKVGIAAPPIKTDIGWLLIFHALSKYDLKYRLGAMLLDLNNPLKIIKMLDYPILEPQTDYENSGYRPGTVFSCGAVLKNRKIFVYYGSGDKYVAVATGDLNSFISALS